PQLRLAAVVDPAPGPRAVFATEAATFADLDALFAARLRLDAALVLAPPVHHEALAVRLLESGLHVLCEKPLAPTVAAARVMLATARGAGRVLMMGSKFRYTPDVAAAKELLLRRCCGDVVMYENVFCSHVDMTRRWNAQAAISGGGVLIDNGCHSVDLARFLLGPIAKVQAQFGRRAQQVQVEDTARILFTSKSEALGSIDLSWSVHKETDAYVRIHGNAGTLEIGWKGSRWKTAGGAWQTFGQGYDKIAAFQNQLRNFVGAVRGEDLPVIGDADALASVVVVDCAYRSAAEERWIAVPFEPVGG
ncbi:MAG: Gfo/Idh/MocA family oxidoreductase, partial [Planctomycetes bacterium]|nr:Gfo/Idh/MocA family oxidoreductase [Planctomycetota bacterium]